MTQKKADKKLMLIGWDGADWKVINPMMEAGLLPNLEQLVNGGTIGNLATLDPPFSPMLWTSIATGKRPYKHGVHGFTEPDPDGVNIRPVLSVSRKCKAIWNILSQNKYKTHVSGWWPSHPAEPVNGISISNFYQRPGKDGLDNWKMAPHSVFPESLAQQFSYFRIHPSELTGAHIQPFIPDLVKIGNRFGKPINNLTQIIAENSSLHAAFTHILRTQDWNFASVYFDGIDRVCHDFMKYYPPRRSHIPKDEFDLFKDVVTGIYRFSDMMLGRLIQLAGDDATIMLVSDHGFQPGHLRPRAIPHEPAGIAYEHSPYGIFCIKGPGIKKDSLVHGAGLLDITPTILHLFDLPIGDDMDGMPLLSIFEKPIIPKTISSWESISGDLNIPVETNLDNRAFIDKMMEQLVDLGYVEKPDENKEKAYQHTRRFCETNLARAYLDGGQIEQATDLFEKLYTENSNAPWIAYRLAICYQMTGQHVKCRSIIEKLKAGHFYESGFINTMEASLLMGEGKYQMAVDLLKKIEKEVPENTQNIYLKIGRCYSMLGKPTEAMEALQKELEIDFENPTAHQFLGAIYFNQGRFEEATEYLLNAISLDYSKAEAHYTLGRTLIAQGLYEEAADALQVTLGMAPFNNHARQLLAYVYKTHLNDPAKASKVMQDFNNYLLGTIIVVSGLPRSGTSMMMQMLEKGGIPIFTDGERQMDESNPKGYFEHQVVKKITHNTHWLKTSRDKAVKIVVPLVSNLPYNYRYKIIFMERDLNEIYASQLKMLNKMGHLKKTDTYAPEMIKTLENTIKDTKQWIARHPSAEVIYINYKTVLSAPLEQAVRINEFLDEPINPVAMIEAIDPSLYREKNNA